MKIGELSGTNTKNLHSAFRSVFSECKDKAIRLKLLKRLSIAFQSTLLFPYHQHIKIIIQRQVAVFVNKTVRTAFLGYI